PAAYEYADKDVGYGKVLAEFQSAKTVAGMQRADDDISMMTNGLRALLDDQNDKTAPSRPHATDLRMMRLDGVTQGKVIVVSLVEQVVRFYDNGKLVFWSYVTTGRMELPSPPGLHFAMNKASPVLFTSPEPRSSPFWFEPTPVKYAIEYADGGDFLHDAWWRNQFGPGTNLPHYDPIAFNGGSHGCINFPLKAMVWVYAWTQVGTPVLVY
ncbi:MAG TPA: L,D-transpeptidase, partial [Ktedonobacterales bacterium]|nr:L,D-transpeptidase [Ktedonobacterales bacterium]